MPAVVADTHAAVWYLTNSPRLSAAAAKALDDASAAGNSILIPSISLVELIDRNVVPDLPDRVIAATALSSGAALVSRDGKIRTSQIQTIW